jgi:uncharacterized phage protein (TIGR02220 family)
MKVRIEWAVCRGVALDKALSDPRLSFRAKGLLAHMLSVSPGAAVDVKGLANASSEGRDAIGTALQELGAAGYCSRTERIDDGGTSGGGTSDSEVALAPVMESLFGESFAAPVPVSELPDTRQGGTMSREEVAVERIIDHLNRLRERSWGWAQYTPLSAKYAKNVEHINGRLRDGYSEEDLILVLDYLAATDGGKEDSRRYFNCTTPFNTKNFEGNLAMAREWKARGRRPLGRRVPGTSRGRDYYLGTREDE